MRLVVVALCIVASLRVAAAEPSERWSVAARAGIAYQHRNGFFEFSTPRPALQLTVGRILRRDLTVGLGVIVRPEVGIGGADFGLTRSRLGVYDIGDQMGHLFVERRWERFTLYSALGITHETISGTYAVSSGPCPYDIYDEEFRRYGIGESLGIAAAHRWGAVALEARLDVSAAQLDHGTQRSVENPNTLGQSVKTTDGPSDFESGFEAALWVGVRWN